MTGLGVSGFAAADTLAELGADVVVVDSRDSAEQRERADTLRIVGVAEILLGEQHVRELPLINGGQADLLVTSPGWRPDSALISQARRSGVPVWSEVELAWRLGPRPGARTPEWLVITGTNGKTTTTALLERMLINDGRRAIACGNIGVPVLDAMRDPEGYEALAVELSSFQLHYTELLDPLASAVLNIAEDHVDWHGSFEGYCADKARIYENTRVACVYNADSPVTEQMVAEADVQEGCRAIGFTMGAPGPSMIGVVEDLLVDRAFLENRQKQALELGALDDFGAIAPQHVVANTLAAAALARAADVDPAAVRQTILEYTPAAHRIQPVPTSDGVLWINDTKATNPHAAEASLRSFSDIVWIAGGLSKGVDFDPLVIAIAERLRHVILIGTDSAQLRASLERHAPHVAVIGGRPGEDHLSDPPPGTAASPRAAPDAAEAALNGADGEAAMSTAVAEAARVASPGTTVLLAPASASMDQFSSYMARGDSFIEAVTARDHQGGTPGAAS